MRDERQSAERDFSMRLVLALGVFWGAWAHDLLGWTWVAVGIGFALLVAFGDLVRRAWKEAGRDV